MISYVVLKKKCFKEVTSIRGNRGAVHGEMLKQSVEKPQFCGELQICYHEARRIMKLDMLQFEPRAPDA
jgi:hypothetical protein